MVEYDQVLKKVSALIAGYPTKEALFGSSQKFVLFSRFTGKFQRHLYDYLVANAQSDIIPYRMLVPSKLDGENITFIFYDFSTESSWNGYAAGSERVTEDLADTIYLTKVILKQPLNAIVLCDDKIYSCPSKPLCPSCVGRMSCKNNPKFPCFTGDEFNYENSQMRSKFFEFLFQKLKFETIDPETFKWEVLTFNRQSIIRIFRGFNSDVASFGKGVCDYIAPSDSYESTDIALQNQTYVRFQATHSFRFVRKEDLYAGRQPPVEYLYIPDNFEEVFKQLNSSSAGIDGILQAITEKIQYIDILTFSRPGEAFVPELVNGYLKNLKSILTEINLILVNEEKTHQFLDIHQNLQYLKKTLNFDSATFKQTVATKFQDISTNLIDSIVDIHVESFSNLLSQLNTRVDEFLQDLQQDTKISGFFRDLNKKFDDYFSYSNAYMINSWFVLHRRRVPHDWQARLVGFGRADRYWLDAGIDMKNITFSEFVDNLDFNFRRSFEFLGDNIDLYILSVLSQDRSDLDQVERLVHTNNFKHFLGEWKAIIGSRPRSFIELVKNNQKIEDLPYETVQFNFRDSVKRAGLFTRENLDFIKDQLEHYHLKDLVYNQTTVQTIYSQLQTQGQPLLKDFKKKSMDRVIFKMIRLESSRLDPVLDRLSSILIKELKLQHKDFGLWFDSQPYQKMIALKYSLTTYEDFLLETKTIFLSNGLDIHDGEEMEYLESLKLKLEHLHKQAELTSFEERSNTRWNWGRGFVKDEGSVKSSGAVLRSPINFGFRSAESVIKEGTINSFEGSLSIFLFWGLVMLLKMMKVNLGF